MTMVLGLRENGYVYMAADSVAAGAELTVIRKEAKLFWNGPYLIGFCGSFRFGQIVKFCELPRMPLELFGGDDNKVEGFFVREFVPALQDAMEDSGINHDDLNESSLMVGVGQYLFIIEPGFQVSSYMHDYAALGVAEQAGLVGLDVISGGLPENRLNRVLESIEKHSIYVKRPWVFGNTSEVDNNSDNDQK